MRTVDAPRGTPATLLSLLRDGPRQAHVLAADLGIDTSAARRHLEGLRRDGLVATTDVVDGPGRPKKMYALTAAGRETFPRDYGLLLDLVLAKVRERRDRTELVTLLRLVAKDLAREIDGSSARERLASLVRFYDTLGFEATLESTRRVGDVRLVQRNCIFLRTARGDPPLFCDCFDEGIIRAALPGALVELETSQARGDVRCSHVIRLGKPARA